MLGLECVTQGLTGRAVLAPCAEASQRLLGAGPGGVEVTWPGVTWVGLGSQPGSNVSTILKFHVFRKFVTRPKEYFETPLPREREGERERERERASERA